MHPLNASSLWTLFPPYQTRCTHPALAAAQGEELEPARQKAEAAGVKEIYIDDLREEFVGDFVFPMFRCVLCACAGRWAGWHLAVLCCQHLSFFRAAHLMLLTC